MKNTVTQVVKAGLCTSCGICVGACNKNCITFHYGKERNFPVVDYNKCVDCNLCYDVCPGKGVLLNKLSEDFFGAERGINTNICAGHYLHSYVGHSTNDELRFHAATGGMVSQFLIWLLQKQYIDGAVVVRYRKDSPFEPEPFIATTKEEIWESRSSKYVIISMDKIAIEIAKMKGRRLAVVGLPCQIQGWRQLAMRNKNVRDAIIGYFAIYCSINKTKHSLDYYPWRYHVNPNEVGRFSFRDDGCMGYMKFSDKEGRDIKRIPYLSFWFGTHSFFTNPRCTLCIDQLGELADISFGDIHIKPYSDDTIGTNSIISRSSYWDSLLVECSKDGYVTLDEIPIDEVIKSQQYTKVYKKGAGVKTNFFLRKMIGKKNPVYDYKYQGNVNAKSCLSELNKALMRLIGRYRSFWFIVRLLDKNRV